MATSNRERQKKYRELQRQAGAKRLDIILSNESYQQLAQIALAGNKTKKAVIEELLKGEFGRIAPTENLPAIEQKKLAWFEQPTPSYVTV